jgi:hypothetical protein
MDGRESKELTTIEWTINLRYYSYFSLSRKIKGIYSRIKTSTSLIGKRVVFVPGVFIRQTNK